MTFNCLIDACGKAQDLDRAFHVFGLMRHYDQACLPNPDPDPNLDPDPDPDLDPDPDPDLDPNPDPDPDPDPSPNPGPDPSPGAPLRPGA